MGFRFRKSVKIAPGVKVNFGKKSVGVSIGNKAGGLSFNSKTGARARVSIPGTGISYSSKLAGRKKGRSGSKKVASTVTGSYSTVVSTGYYKPVCLRWWYFGIIAVFAIGGFGNLGTDTGATIFGIAVAAIMSFFSIRAARKVKSTGAEEDITEAPVDDQGEMEKQAETVLDELNNAEDFGTISKILSENNIISEPEDDFHNSFGDDLRHLTEDGELPWGWVHSNQDFINLQEGKIDAKWKAVRNAPSAQVKIDAYRKYFNAITRIGIECKEAGECHYKWFCEDVIESVWYNDQLNDYEKLKAEAPELIKRENLLTNLEADIMIKLHEYNGILQSEFIKLFDPSIKSEVSTFLYEADKAGKIKRTKSGRSYILEIKP